MLAYHLYGSNSLFFHIRASTNTSAHHTVVRQKKKKLLFSQKEKIFKREYWCYHRACARISRAEGILSQPVKCLLVRFLKIIVKVERGGEEKTGKIWMAMSLLNDFRLLISTINPLRIQEQVECCRWVLCGICINLREREGSSPITFFLLSFTSSGSST